jgi:hypothetical protein
VEPQPALLEQVVGVAAAHRLRQKEPVQGRAELVYQRRHRGRIALLISPHEVLELGVRRHGGERSPIIMVSPVVSGKLRTRRTAADTFEI